jgi:hypothetical protein
MVFAISPFSILLPVNEDSIQIAPYPALISLLPLFWWRLSDGDPRAFSHQYHKDIGYTIHVFLTAQTTRSFLCYNNFILIL